jgi:2-keto-3-deoxy-galactonokinase
MGLNYLNALNNINEVASATLPVRIAVLHQAGVVGVTNAPYVDLPVCLNNIGIRQAGVTDPGLAAEAMNKTFMAGVYWASMLEHSIIEQMLITDASATNTHLNKRGLDNKVRADLRGKRSHDLRGEDAGAVERREINRGGAAKL